MDYVPAEVERVVVEHGDFVEINQGNLDPSILIFELVAVEDATSPEESVIVAMTPPQVYELIGKLIKLHAQVFAARADKLAYEANNKPEGESDVRSVTDCPPTDQQSRAHLQLLPIRKGSDNSTEHTNR